MPFRRRHQFDLRPTMGGTHEHVHHHVAPVGLGPSYPIDFELAVQLLGCDGPHGRNCEVVRLRYRRNDIFFRSLSAAVPEFWR